MKPENKLFRQILAGKRLRKKFFLKPTLKVAQQLLGKYLVVKRGTSFQIGQIMETEAYVGPEDKASHASKGRTARAEIMFGPAARLYIYLIYGMYYCLNIVTEKKGYPAAVLIRGLKPIFGIKGEVDGPGKICRELKINNSHNNLDVTTSDKIFILDGAQRPKKIISSSRIGVNYAGQWAKKEWRFFFK